MINKNTLSLAVFVLVAGLSARANCALLKQAAPCPSMEEVSRDCAATPDCVCDGTCTLRIIKNGNYQSLRARVSEPDFSINRPLNPENQTPLTIAVCYAGSRTDIVRLLIACNAELECRDSNGRTALLHAVAGHNPDLVRILLLAGARINREAIARIPIEDSVEGQRKYNAIASMLTACEKFDSTSRSRSLPPTWAQQWKIIRENITNTSCSS
jgi:hypothetical protein